MANLTGQNIKDTYQEIVTLGTGNTITNGTGSQITSLDVTASYATQAVTASYALNVPTIDTGSLMLTGSVSGNVLTFEKADGSTFALTVDTGSAQATSTGSLLTTASLAGNDLTFTKGDSSTFSIDLSTVQPDLGPINAFTASADARLAALELETGSLQSQITSNDTEIASLTAATSSYATVVELNASSSALQSNIDGVQSNLDNVSSSLAARDAVNESAISTNAAGIASLTAETASYAKTNVNNIFSGTQTFDNIAVNGTGSFAYIQQITGSAKIIGDAFIVLNNNTPTERYAGIIVQDSGSGAPNTTASFFFDGSTNDWNYEYSTDGGATVDLGVAMFGPEYNTKGSPVYPTANTLVKGNGHHLEDSSISDNGSIVSITNPVNVTGAVTASAGFSGNLVGNAATATSASHAVIADSALAANTATSASHAIIADSALTATSASYATSALTASYALNADLQASTETGTILLQNIAGEIYGSAASPTSGNITVTTAAKTPGAVAIIYHQDTVEPSLINVTVDKKVGNYDVSALNIITLTQISGNNVLEYIAGADISFAVSSSYSAFAVNASTASLATNALVAADADQVLVVEKSDNVDYQLIFRQDAVNQYSDIFADSANALTFNPSTGVLVVPSTTTTASYALSALTASYAENTAPAVSASYALSSSYASTTDLAVRSYNYNTSSGSIGFWQGSQAEYNTISGSASDSIIYFIV